MRTIFVCCVLLTITISATCFQRRFRHQQIMERKSNERLIKRDTSLLVDTAPLDIESVQKVHPVIAFRRLSKSRQKPRPKQSPRLLKSSKKYKKPAKPKYSPYKSRGFKPGYYKKRLVSKNKNVPRPPKFLPPYSSYQTDGFGEPPSDLISYSKPPKHAYQQELTDSYGEPIKASNIDNYPPIHPSQFSKNPDLRPAYNSWHDFERPNVDNIYAYSKKRPAYDKPEPYEAQEMDREPQLNNYYYWARHIPHFNIDQSKFEKIPWNTKSKGTKDEDEIIVGGQYAEPPARFVAKFQPSAPMYNDNEDFAPPRRHRNPDPEIGASATISPYVNYKHSNMAFSPQNLNDAFSIVD